MAEWACFAARRGSRRKVMRGGLLPALAGALAVMLLGSLAGAQDQPPPPPPGQAAPERLSITDDTRGPPVPRRAACGRASSGVIGSSPDSPLEGSGFELSVPPQKERPFGGASPQLLRPYKPFLSFRRVTKIARDGGPRVRIHFPPPKSHANPIIAKDLDGRASGKSPTISRQAATEEQGPRFALPGNASVARSGSGDRALPTGSSSDPSTQYPVTNSPASFRPAARPHPTGQGARPKGPR
jgi:hypothetical protein